MGMNWTAAQSRAIEQLNRSLLVSAAAGSGKTATLTERIIRSICDPEINADLSRMLIVTYTRAAATDLKNKISDALSKKLADEPLNRHLSQQSIRLANAQISTVHSFCLGVIRENFSEFGVSASLKVMDDTEAKVLREDIMQDLIEECYSGECKAIEAGPEEFGAIADCITSVQKTEELADILLGLISKLEVRGDPEIQLGDFGREYLNITEDFEKSKFYEAITKEFEIELLMYQDKLLAACQYVDADKELSDKLLESLLIQLNFANKLQDALYEGLKQFYDLALTYSKPSAPRFPSGRVEGKFLVSGTRSAFNDYMKKLPARINKIFVDIERGTNERIVDILIVLFDLFGEFSRRLWKEKTRRGVCEFSDLERLMLEHLVKFGKRTALAESICEKFDYIYVDEYQDINPTQNAIFEAISRPDNLFRVGDVKQSIYSFQGGDPEIFAALRATVDNNRETIYMSENFRCDSTVIDFVNSIFEKLMPIGNPCFGYKAEEDNLVCAKQPHPENPIRTKVVLIEPPLKDKENPDPERQASGDVIFEARWVADEISRLLKEAKKSDGTAITPRDIAILLHSVNGKGRIFAQELSKRGIPYRTRAKTSLLESPEAMIMVGLLNAIDNPMRDISLVSAMESPLFGFTMDELMLIRREGTAGVPFYEALREYCDSHGEFVKGASFLKTLDSYREYARSSPVDKLIMHIYQTTGIYALADDKSKKTNLNLFYEAARAFEGGSFKGLYNFIQYLEEASAKSGNLPGANTASTDLDAVTITTMHSSKGLEFPVCFVSYCSKREDQRDMANPILYHPSLGVSLEILDKSGYVKYENPWNDIVKKSIRRSMREEKHRLLYVALTRARERLYVTAYVPSIDKTFEKAKAERECLTQCALTDMTLFIDIVLSCADPLTYDLVRHYATDELAPEEDRSEAEQAEAVEGEMEKAGAIAEQMLDRLQFEYPHLALTHLPAKLSVSKLSPNILELFESNEASLDDRQLPQMRKLKELDAEKSADSAEIGTATHTFLQFCDFDAAKADLESEMKRLCDEGFIPKRYAEIAQHKLLKDFFESDFFARMRNADKLYREFRFNLKLPCDAFTQDAQLKEELSGEELLVQGVIDCFFEEDGEIVIVDYKTDHLTPWELSHPEAAAEKLITRHKTQLIYYAEACRRICEKNIRGVYIYSLAAGREFLLPLTDIK